jgi:hypothetical protein
MNFRELLEKLEHHLGSHQVPLNPHARGIKDVFESTPLHPEFMTRFVRALYQVNTCRTLTDPVDRAASLDALAPLRLERLRAASTDVDVHRLLDDLCVALDEAFSQHPASKPPPTALRIKRTAEIIPFDSFRRRRLKTSA